MTAAPPDASGAQGVQPWPHASPPQFVCNMPPAPPGSGEWSIGYFYGVLYAAHPLMPLHVLRDGKCVPMEFAPLAGGAGE